MAERSGGTVPGLTEYEHRARAMMMGLEFEPALNYYFDNEDKLNGTYRVDADTLEPIGIGEVLDRSARYEANRLLKRQL